MLLNRPGIISHYANRKALLHERPFFLLTSARKLLCMGFSLPSELDPQLQIVQLPADRCRSYEVQILCANSLTLFVLLLSSLTAA